MELTNNKLILSEKTLSTKKQILDYISKTAVDGGYLKTKKPLLDAFMKREEEFPTGMGDGIAIPHAEVDGLESPLIIVVRTKDLDWGSIDDSKVNTVIAIMVPKGGRGDHLAILAELAKKLVNKDFANIMKKGSKAEVVKSINSIEPGSEEKEQKTKKGTKYVIGITACPTGIAHTFMAQQKIVDAAKDRGYSYRVETQGSEGIKDKLSVEDIQKADAIIISTAIQLEEMERFEGFEGKIKTSELQNTIANAPEVLEEALAVAEEFNKNGGGLAKTGVQTTTFNFAPEKSRFDTVMGHIMTGISAMIPVLLIAGLLMAIGNIGALGTTIPNTNSIGDSMYATSDFNAWINLMYYINQIGSIVMKFMYPIFAMYLAFSIGGKLALIPGFMGGVMAAGLETSFLSGDIYSSSLLSWAYPNGFIPSMFFGALFIGAFVGIMTKWLNTKIQLSPNLVTLKTMLIIPLIMSVSVFLVMAFAVNPFFGMINALTQQAFNAAGQSGTLLYQMSIAAGTAFDLGGPINKAAGAVANGMNTDAFDLLTTTLNDSTSTAEEITAAVNNLSTFNITGRTLGIIVPPIGIGVAAMSANTVTGRELFTKEEQQLGGQAAFLGAIGISEGAIPMMMKYPVYVITADIIGAMVAAVIGVIFGSIQTLPLPAIWGWFLVGTTTQGAAAYGVAGIGVQVLGYILAVLVGVVTVAAIFTLFLLQSDVRANKKNKIYNKNEITTLAASQKVAVVEQSTKSIENVKAFYENQLKSINVQRSKDKNKFDKDEIENAKINFSKLKVELGKESKLLANLKYKIMRNDQKNGVFRSKIDLSSNEEHIAKWKAAIKANDELNIQLEKDVAVAKENLGKFISMKINYLEEIEKTLK